MQINRLIITSLLSLALSGCNNNLIEENDTLRQQVLQLSAEIKNKKQILDYFEHQAAIAAACDEWVPLCPNSITEVGHKAQKEGYAGGSDWIFWTILSLKVTILGFLLSGIIGGMHVLRIYVIFPSKANLERATQLINHANIKIQQAREPISNAQEELNSLKDKIAHLNKVAIALQELIAIKQKTLDQLQIKITQEKAEENEGEKALDFDL